MNELIEMMTHLGANQSGEETAILLIMRESLVVEGQYQWAFRIPDQYFLTGGEQQ